MSDRPKIEYASPAEQKCREIDSLAIESSLLTGFEFYFKDLVQKKYAEAELSGRDLAKDLAFKFYTWQEFGDEGLGLDSGGTGESFTRLMAYGIIDDFEVKDYVYTPGDSNRVILQKRPKNEREKVAVTFYAVHDFGGEQKIILFNSKCSLEDIEKRRKSLEIEREIKSREYHNLRKKEYEKDEI